MLDDALKAFCLELMATSGDAAVATIDPDGLPQIRVMFNLRNRERFPSLAPLFESRDGQFLIYLGTNTSSPKIPQLKANPAIAVLFADPARFHSLMLSGRAEIVEDPVLKKALWQDGWELYYPAGPGDPDYTVIRLRPVRGKGWRGDAPFDFPLGEGR